MWVDFPLLNPYSSHMSLPMWVQHGTMLQIPHESLMGCPYRTHINTHLWPMWVLYLLLAGTFSKLQHMVRVMLRQTGKIMTKSSLIINRLSIAVAGLIID